VECRQQAESTEIGLREGEWYNSGKNDFGRGSTLKEGSPWLQKDHERNRVAPPRLPGVESWYGIDD